jgi:hypothetical protein
MKYKLIKKYPGLSSQVEIGDIAEFDVKLNYFHINSNYSTQWTKNYFENYPEFWEEMEENNFEILSFTKVKSNDKIRFILGKDGCYHLEDTEFCKFSLNSLLHQNQCVDSGDFIIESIKRLSDNEVFTIGDKVKHSYLSQDNSTITKIYIIEKIYSLNSDGIRFYVGNGLNLGLRQLEKILELIFITEDGVELFEGDDFWHVDRWFGIARGNVINANLFTKLTNYHLFSTREKAQEYVDLYKPQYSMKNILGSSQNFLNINDLTLIDLNKLKSKK